MHILIFILNFFRVKFALKGRDNVLVCSYRTAGKLFKMRNAYLMLNSIQILHFENNQGKIKSVETKTLFVLQRNIMISKHRNAFLRGVLKQMVANPRKVCHFRVQFFLDVSKFVNLN